MNEMPEMNPQHTQDQVAGINRFYSKVYGFLGFGVLLSGLVAYLSLQSFQVKLPALSKTFHWDLLASGSLKLR